MRFTITLPLKGTPVAEPNTADFVRTISRANDSLVFVGRADVPDLDHALENFSGCASQPPFPGRYVLVATCAHTGRISVWTDKYRLMGAYAYRDTHGLIVSNDRTRLPSHFEADPEALADLLLFGYVLPPRTLFREVIMLSGLDEWTSRGERIQSKDWRDLWTQSQKSLTPEAFLHIFNLECRRLIGDWRPHVFRLSGGMDTRLIANCLGPEHWSQIKAQVLCSPFLSDIEDRDVMGARAMARSLGFDLEVCHPSPDHYAFLAGLKSAALSGLWGGELLGAVAYSDMPSVAFDNCLRLDEHSGIANHWFASSTDRFQSAIRRYGSSNFILSIYLGSFRSAIYQSVHLGWANPHELVQYALSPFATESVLDAIQSVPLSERMNYRYYRTIAEHGLQSDLKAIPLNSPITDEDFSIPAQVLGKDPKSISYASEAVARPWPAIRRNEFLCLGFADPEESCWTPQQRLRLNNICLAIEGATGRDEERPSVVRDQITAL